MVKAPGRVGEPQPARAQCPRDQGPLGSWLVLASGLPGEQILLPCLSLQHPDRRLFRTCDAGPEYQGLAECPESEFSGDVRTLCRPEPLDSPLEMGAPVQEGTFASDALVVRSKYPSTALGPAGLAGLLLSALPVRSLSAKGSSKLADPTGQQ